MEQARASASPTPLLPGPPPPYSTATGNSSRFPLHGPCSANDTQQLDNNEVRRPAHVIDIAASTIVQGHDNIVSVDAGALGARLGVLVSSILSTRQREFSETYPPLNVRIDCQVKVSGDRNVVGCVVKRAAPEQMAGQGQRAPKRKAEGDAQGGVDAKRPQR